MTIGGIPVVFGWLTAVDLNLCYDLAISHYTLASYISMTLKLMLQIM